MLAIVCWITALDPWPISTITITAATPIMIPSVVRIARMMLRRRA